MKFTSPYLRSATFAVVALALSFSSTHLQAATGDELLMGALPSSAMNKSVVDGDTLVKAVYDAVIANKSQAPEIVGAAIPKTRSIATQNAIVKAAVSALGTSTKLVPQVVYSAVKAAPNCGTSDGKSGYSKDGAAGCQCAEQFSKSAIEALGSNPSEQLVTDIVSSAIQATDGRCARQIANSASEAAPQYASAIADTAAKAGSGENANDGAFENGLVFGSTGRPIPAPFTLQPQASGGGAISTPTTPVLNN